MRLRSALSLIVVVVFVASAVIGFFYINSILAMSSQPTTTISNPTPNQIRTGRIGETAMNIEVADTPLARIQGLSGRSALADDQAMLFDFQQSAYPSMWMKDMRFSLDFLWVDENHRVVGITPNISPDTYPQTFTSPAPVRYVIEVDDGWTSRHHSQIGDSVIW